MKYKLLGKSGLRVSELCLGTMTFGEDWGWGSSKEESRGIYDAFLEAGGNFIDTANVYTNGKSEEFLGEFMKERREGIVLATKYTNSSPTNDPNASGNHRKSLVHSVEASLKRLQTDYIDLLWLHIWDRITPVEEVMRALDDLIRQGKVLYIGVSDAPAWWIAKANTLAELRGWSQFVGLQIEYSLIERTPERELLPMAKDFGLTIAAWSPLAGGILTGKYLDRSQSDGRYNDSAMRQFMTGAEERNKRIAQTVKAIADNSHYSAAQIALAWLRSRLVPVIPIIGARKLSQLQDNIACLEVTLTDEQRQQLDEVSQIEMGFPYDFYEKDMVKMFVYGGMRDRLSV